MTNFLFILYILNNLALFFNRKKIGHKKYNINNARGIM